MKAIILCAGYATRLHPLTKFIAKQLLPVCGKPVLNFIVHKLEEIDEIDEIYITTTKKSNNQFEEWLFGYEHLFKKKIKLFENSYFLGEKNVGGVDAISRIVKKYKIKEDILVIAGDNLFDYSLKGALNFFKQKNSTVLILSKLKNRKKASNFGVVEIDKNNKVINFEEKPDKPKSDLISTAIYFFPRSDLNLIDSYHKSEHKGNSFGYFLKFLYKQENVYGFVPNGTFLDIGSIEDYKRANKICENW
jgi:glucose-1-phosphate thymidylyltransferase